MKNKKLNEKSNMIFNNIIKSTLVFFPVFIGLGIFIISRGNMILFSLGGFVMGISGIIIIIRKEIPTVITNIRGTRAIVEGIIITIICWGLSIVILIEGLKLNP